MVVWLLGQLLLPLMGLAVVPFVVALAFGDIGFALRCAAVAAVFALAGWFMARVEAATDVRRNEALSVTALIFTIAAAGMTWPLAGDGLSPLDAWFESVSGITTTGLSTLADVEDHSSAFLFTRVWMQW